MKDATAIVGVGRTRSDRDPNGDVMLHLTRALKRAVEDAGLSRADIDGLMVNCVPDEAAMDKFPEMAGLEEIQWALQTWPHGRMQPTCIAVAAWAVMHGQAKYVACISAAQPYAGLDLNLARFPEAAREGGGPHLEAPPYGMVSVSGGAALGLRAYLNRYGGDREQLGAVAVAQRAWAQLNPDAYWHGRPISMDDYVRSPYVVEPLRVLDHCTPANAGFCIIVTTAERARDCAKAPIYISGVQGSASGRDHFVFARSGLPVGQQRQVAARNARDMPVYRMAGVTPEDVDMVGVLDAFAPLVLYGLEEFGYCGEGEALEWIQDGRTAPGGTLPVNTCGGGLSDAESFGWGHQVDMVGQLRGEAGEGQIPGATVAHYISTDNSALILRRD